MRDESNLSVQPLKAMLLLSLFSFNFAVLTTVVSRIFFDVERPFCLKIIEHCVKGVQKTTGLDFGLNFVDKVDLFDSCLSVNFPSSAFVAF